MSEKPDLTDHLDTLRTLLADKPACKHRLGNRITNAIRALVADVERLTAENAELRTLRAFDTGTKALPRGLMLEHARLDRYWQSLIRERDELQQQVADLCAMLTEQYHGDMPVPNWLVMAQSLRDMREGRCVPLDQVIADLKAAEAAKKGGE